MKKLRFIIYILIFICIFFYTKAVFAQVNNNLDENIEFPIESSQETNIAKPYSDGSKIDIFVPNNAFLTDVKLSLDQISPSIYCNPLTRYNSSLIGSSTIKFSAKDFLGKEIVKLNDKIIIQITLPKNFLLNSSTTGIYYFDTISPKWVLISDAKINSDQNTIEFEIDRLYNFAIFNTPQIPDILKVKESALATLSKLDYGDRNLLRDEANGKIYIISQNKKIYLSNLQELQKYPGIPIYNATEEHLNVYPLVDLITLRDRPYSGNVLLRNVDNDRMYLITSGMRKYLPSISEVKSLHHYKTIVVNSEIINSYPLLK